MDEGGCKVFLDILFFVKWRIKFTFDGGKDQFVSTQTEAEKTSWKHS
ncbi:MAG: hypothetical protein ABIT08_14490 [Bacteroidia bacterium]